MSRTQAPRLPRPLRNAVCWLGLCCLLLTTPPALKAHSFNRLGSAKRMSRGTGGLPSAAFHAPAAMSRPLDCDLGDCAGGTQINEQLAQGHFFRVTFGIAQSGTIKGRLIAPEGTLFYLFLKKMGMAKGSTIPPNCGPKNRSGDYQDHLL